jgi:hypothetical protein
VTALHARAHDGARSSLPILSPQVTSEGVRPAREGESRVTVVCIHNATQDDRQALLKMSTKTPQEISKFLASPDVFVTNKKDKETMLPIVGKTDKHVREMMSGMHRHCV